MKLFVSILVFLFCQFAYSQADIDVSNLALKEMLLQNPDVPGFDERDPVRKFSDLIAPFFNPGANTIYDDKTGDAVTEISYAANSCVLDEDNASFSNYNCTYYVGYLKNIAVDKFGNMSININELLSSGVGISIEFQFKNYNDGTKKIIVAGYYPF